MTHDLTPTQFSMLVRLSERGAGSQNQVGRLAAMDVATAKGVVDRLVAKGLVALAPDPSDARRRTLTLTDKGASIMPQVKRLGSEITAETLEPLSPTERDTLVSLLRRLS